MATENETLQLEVKVEGFDEAASKIQGVEEELQKTDREITDTGSRRNKVGIDVEAFAADAVAELKAINATLETIEDEVTVDVDANTTDAFDAAVGDGGQSIPAPSFERGGTLDTQRRLFGLEDETATQLRGRGDVEKSFIETIQDLDGDNLIRATGDTSTINVSMDERRDLFGLDDIQNQQLEDRGDVEKSFIETIQDLDGDNLIRATGDTSEVDLSMDERRELYGLGDLPDQQLEDRGGGFNIRRQGGFLKQLRRQSGDLLEEFKDAEFTIESFHKIFAAMVPLVVVFVGAMPAAISALAGLATAGVAAAAALGGLGALAIGGMMLTPSGQLSTAPLMERLRGLFDTFLTEFEPVMRQFEGLAIGAFDEFEQMLGPLAQASMSLTVLEDEFSAVVSTITNGLPRAVQAATAFAEVTGPILSTVLGQLMSSNVLKFFANQLNRLAPIIYVLIASLKQILPAIIRVSEGFLLVVTGLSMFAAALSFVINKVPLLGQILGALVSVILVAVSATTLYSLTLGALSTSLGITATSLLGTAKAAVISAATFQSGTVAAIAFWSALTLGIATVAALSTNFLDLADSVGLANTELEKFNELTPGDVGTGDQFGVNGRSPRGGGNSYTTVIDANGQDAAARQQYSESYERQHVDSVFGG